MANSQEQVPTNSNTPKNDEAQLSSFANRAGNILKMGANKLTATAVAGLLTITLAGCGANANAEGPKPTTTHSAEATPTPEATGPKVYTDDELIAMENEPIPESIAQYESMAVADFEALPIEERLTYCSYLNRDQDYLAGKWYDGYNEDARYLVDATNLNEDSTAQEIISADGLTLSNAFVTHFGGIIYDRDTAQKQIACNFYNATSSNELYAYWTDQRNQPYDIVPPTMVAQEGGLKLNNAISEKPSHTVTTESGKEYFARDITSQDASGNTFDGTHILVPYTDYKGEARQTYISYS